MNLADIFSKQVVFDPLASNMYSFFLHKLYSIQNIQEYTSSKLKVNR